MRTKRQLTRMGVVSAKASGYAAATARAVGVASVENAALAGAGPAPAQVFAHRGPRARDLAQLRLRTAIFLRKFRAEDDRLLAPDLFAVETLHLVACGRLERSLGLGIGLGRG